MRGGSTLLGFPVAGHPTVTLLRPRSSRAGRWCCFAGRPVRGGLASSGRTVAGGRASRLPLRARRAGGCRITHRYCLVRGGAEDSDCRAVKGSIPAIVTNFPRSARRRRRGSPVGFGSDPTPGTAATAGSFDSVGFGGGLGARCSLAIVTNSSCGDNGPRVVCRHHLVRTTQRYR